MAVDSSLLYSCLLSKDGGGDEVVKCRVSEIQGLQFTVILDRERQARTSVCHLHVAELDGVVSADEASTTTLKWL